MSRHHPKTAVAVALAGVALTPAGASAYSYPGERPAPELVQRLARKADAFWHKRGVPACASTRTVLMAPSLLEDDDKDGDREPPGTGDGPAPGTAPGADGTSQDVDAAGRALRGDCQQWVADRLVTDTANPQVYGTALDLCTVIYHEAGHTGRLDHAPGLMAPVNPLAPFECRVWARRLEDRKQARQARVTRRTRGNTR